MRFRPPLWAWIAMLPMLALLLALGGWQVRRAQEKERLSADYTTAAVQNPVELSAQSSPPHDVAAIAAQARGRYLSDRQLLLDNQSAHGRPGYHVWTPMRLARGGLIIVDRGWVPLNPDPGVLPEYSA